MELSGYFAVARRWWWTLLVATWVAAMAGLLVASRIAPTYEAQAQLLVGPINTDADTLKASGQLVQTYAQLAVSTPLLKSTAQEIPGLDPQKLAASVRTTASDVTRVLQIRVQDSDPARAAQIANTMSDELIQLTTGATTRPEGQVEVISLAVPPTSPIAPQVSLIVLLAMAAGLIGGLVLVILVEYATDMVRDGADLARLARTDVLATVAFEQRTPGKDPLPVAAAAAPGSSNAVAFRQLASKIAVREGDAPTRSILVTAVGSGDSAVGATGIAAAVAASGRRVVVVDGAADSDITQTLRLQGRSGLREAASDEASPAPQPVNGPVGIEIVPSGVEGSVELLPVDRSEAILAALLADHDLVVIDGGAVQRSTGALGWARVADHTVVLVRRSMSRRDELRQAMESLRYVNARISGTVLVQRTTSRGWRRGRSANAADSTRASRPAAAASSATEVGSPPSLSGASPMAPAATTFEARRVARSGPDAADQPQTASAPVRPIVWSSGNPDRHGAAAPAWGDVPAAADSERAPARTASLEARLAASRPAAPAERAIPDETPGTGQPAATRTRRRAAARPAATASAPSASAPGDATDAAPAARRRKGSAPKAASIVTLLPSAPAGPTDRPAHRRDGSAPSVEVAADPPTEISRVRERAPRTAPRSSAADR